MNLSQLHTRRAARVLLLLSRRSCLVSPCFKPRLPEDPTGWIRLRVPACVRRAPLSFPEQVCMRVCVSDAFFRSLRQCGRRFTARRRWWWAWFHVERWKERKRREVKRLALVARQAGPDEQNSWRWVFLEGSACEICCAGVEGRMACDRSFTCLAGYRRVGQWWQLCVCFFLASVLEGCAKYNVQLCIFYSSVIYWP